MTRDQTNRIVFDSVDWELRRKEKKNQQNVEKQIFN